MPLAISTGMGLNAYFTYNVVGYCELSSTSCVPFCLAADTLVPAWLCSHTCIHMYIETSRRILITCRTKRKSVCLFCSSGLISWPDADGTGSVKYKDALAAIFIEGWIFIILSITGARQFLIKLLPRTLALSMSAGEGLCHYTEATDN